MKLYGRYLSPFVRRVGVSLNVLGMPYEHVEVAPFDEWERAQSYNPVVRIPALGLDDGEMLIDSSAILDYLDDSAGAGRLIPATGAARRDVMKLTAIGLGAMEKAVGAVYEGRFHAPEKVEQSWMDRCDNQAVSALQALDAVAAKAGPDGFLYGGGMTQADITGAVAFAFTALARPKLGIAGKVPALAALAGRLLETPPFKATQP